MSTHNLHHIPHTDEYFAYCTGCPWESGIYLADRAAAAADGAEHVCGAR